MKAKTTRRGQPTQTGHCGAENLYTGGVEMLVTSEGPAPRNPMKSVTETRETDWSWKKEGIGGILHVSHHFTLDVLAERVDNSLNTEGWI